MISWIERKYGKIWTKRGKLRNHLRIVLDYQEKGTVRIIMETYITKILTKYNVTGTA